MGEQTEIALPPRAGMVVLEPGIYPRVFADYRQIDAINQSSLTPISISPLHYRAAQLAGDKPTGGMRLGDVAHCAVLEPHQLGKRYAVWMRSDGGDSFHKSRELDSFRAEAELHGKTVIKQSELDAAMALAATIKRNKLAQRYLSSGVPELTIVWRDQPTGLLCKGRIDWLSKAIEGADVVVELKTTGSITPRVFEPLFAKMQYDVQIAFYADGYKAVTGKPLYGKCVVVESAPPFDVGVYDLTEVIDVGRVYYRRMLDTLAECLRTNIWPGQFTEERVLRLPFWRSNTDGADEGEDVGEEL